MLRAKLAKLEKQLRAATAESAFDACQHSSEAAELVRTTLGRNLSFF